VGPVQANRRIIGAGFRLVGPQRLYALAPGGSLLAIAVLAFDSAMAKIWWSKATTSSRRELTAYLVCSLALCLAAGALMTFLRLGE
jgi:hypothetical protein